MVNNNIKSCTTKAKEKWMGEQCSEILENLSENNSKRVHPLRKDLTTVKQGKVTTVQDRSGKEEEREILNRWAEYCSELYIHMANEDLSVLNCPQTDTGQPPHPSRRSGGSSTIIEERKVARADNMPAELVQAEEVIKGEAVTTALMTICSKIWQTGEWPTPWIQSLVITLPKKGNLQ